MEDVAELVEEGHDLGVAQERGLARGRLREVGDDGADGSLVGAVRRAPAADEVEGGGVTELVGPREEVHVEVGGLAAVRRVQDAVELDVGVPGARWLDGLEADAEEGLHRVEEAGEHGVEGEVLGDGEVVDGEAGLEEVVVVEAPVPELELGVGLAGVGALRLAQGGNVAVALRFDPGAEVDEEVAHGGGPLRHEELEDVGSPGVVAEDVSDLVADGDRLLDELDVVGAALAVVLDRELAAALLGLGVVEEGVHLGVVERNAVEGLAVARLAGEAVDVGRGQAGELVAAQVDGVFVGVDVALEGDAELDEALLQGLDAGALLGVELEAVAAIVAQCPVEETLRLACEGGGLGAGGVVADGAVEVLAEAEVDLVFLEGLAQGVGGGTDGSVLGDVGHEAVAAVGALEEVVDVFEADEGAGEGACARGEGDDLGDDGVGPGDGVALGGFDLERGWDAEVDHGLAPGARAAAPGHMRFDCLIEKGGFARVGRSRESGRGPA